MGSETLGEGARTLHCRLRSLGPASSREVPVNLQMLTTSPHVREARGPYVQWWRQLTTASTAQMPTCAPTPPPAPHVYQLIASSQHQEVGGLSKPKDALFSEARSGIKSRDSDQGP